ncbi:ATP-binding protein [Crossiella sp. NPDC003009]
MFTPELLGRDTASATLCSLVRGGGFALVTGEAGIGKTSLVSAVAAETGALVLTGACWGDAGVPDRWPWVQVSRALRAAATPAEWAAAAPALEALLGEREPAAFPLADALTGLLTTLAARTPVLLVLEDLHWADAASVALLEFVVQHSARTPLAIVATYRDGEVNDPGHPLAGTLPALSAKAVQLPLGGLNEQAVGELIQRTTGLDPEAELVTRIHRRTEGNPFFVEQTARLWQGGSSLDTLDPGITALLRRRLSRLPEQVVDLLGSVAILGRSAHRDLLAALHPGLPVARLLDQALVARLIRAEGEQVRFQHELLRDTVRSGLSTPAERHAAVIRAEIAHELLMPAELAHHAHHGAAALPSAEVLRHQLRAAQDATARFAFDEAARHYRNALPHARETERNRVQLHLGESAHLAGERGTARAAFRTAMATARDLDDPDLLTRTALTLTWLTRHDSADPDQLAFIRETHARLLPGSPAEDDQTAGALARHAADLARQAGDDNALRFALFNYLGFLWSMDTVHTRLDLTTELLELAQRTQDEDLAFEATAWRAGAYLELGDPAHLANHRRLLAMAERSGLPVHRHEAEVTQCLLATLRGDFTAARAHADQARGIGDQPYFTAADLWTVHRAAIAVRQGDLTDLDRVLAGRDPRFMPLLDGLSATRRGDLATATRLLAEEGTPSRWSTALWLRLRVETALLSGDPDRLAELHAELLPQADRWAITGTVVLEAPVRTWLAKLSTAMGDWPQATAHAEAALAAATTLGARPWAAEARADLAHALLAQGEPSGTALLAEAEQEAAGLGMTLPQPVAAPPRDHTAPAAGPAHAGHPSDPAPAPAPAPDNVFRRSPTGWQLTFAGHTTHLPDAKGLQDLHHLLNAPDREAPAVHLLSPGATTPALGSDPVLDDTAKAAYRTRLAALDQEIEDTLDDARAERLERERQALIDELRAATGLLGRSRRLGDEAERARKAVTNRIRDTLRRLDSSHPELAAHLRASVFTGSICRYRPATPVTWRL